MLKRVEPSLIYQTFRSGLSHNRAPFFPLDALSGSSGCDAGPVPAPWPVRWRSRMRRMRTADPFKLAGADSRDAF